LNIHVKLPKLFIYISKYIYPFINILIKFFLVEKEPITMN